MCFNRTTKFILDNSVRRRLLSSIDTEMTCLKLCRARESHISISVIVDKIELHESEIQAIDRLYSLSIALRQPKKLLTKYSVYLYISISKKIRNSIERALKIANISCLITTRQMQPAAVALLLFRQLREESLRKASPELFKQCQERERERRRSYPKRNCRRRTHAIYSDLWTRRWTFQESWKLCETTWVMSFAKYAELCGTSLPFKLKDSLFFFLFFSGKFSWKLEYNLV